MKKLILFLFALSISPLLFAQDFRIIPENTERIYLKSNRGYAVEEVVNIDTDPNSIVINLQGKLTEDRSTNLQGIECYENEFSGALGLAITIDESGDQWIRFRNGGLEFARIISNAQAGESWFCTRYNSEDITATCESIISTTINGVTDVFKTISFSSLNCELILSENNGVVQTPDWSSFAREAPLTINCLEREFNQNTIDKFSIPFGDLASDLQAGDELHIYESYGHVNAGILKEKKIKATFVSAALVDDNYVLTFYQEVEYFELINGVELDTSYIETVNQNMPKHIPVGVSDNNYPLPVDKLFWLGEEAEVCNYSEFNDKLAMTHSVLSYMWDSDSIDHDLCFPVWLDVGYYDTYIDGLAGPYFISGYFPNERRLKYYKKGDEEWGTPYTFTISTSEKIISESVSIFPNPVAAGAQLFLQDLGGKEILEIQLIDLYGKQVQSWQLKNTTNQETLDLQKNIPVGMYVLWITNGGQKQYYSKVLVK
jgi:hypothetical protein